MERYLKERQIEQTPLIDPNEDYYVTRFPWNRVWTAFGGEDTEWMITFKGNNVRRKKMKNYRELLELANPKHDIVSVHVAHDWSRFLVFDIDVRDSDIFKECSVHHAANSRICPTCWEVARVAAAGIERILNGLYGLTAKPLYIFSGSGGLHIWYRFVNPTEQLAFATNEAREAVLALPGMPRVDRNVTAVERHMLRVPFSINEKSGRMARPIDPATLDFPAPDSDAAAREEALARLAKWHSDEEPRLPFILL